MREPRNLVFILSESHSQNVLGCYAHPIVRTPNLDRIAEQGARFTDAYCASPLCVPSRASIATGLYAHQHECWESSLAYDGRSPNWMRHLRDRGHEVSAIGKLHFQSTDNDNGFSEEILPMHIADGIGELIGLLRCSGQEPVRNGIWEKYVSGTGVGGITPYQEYDDQITAEAVKWLNGHAKPSEKPWVICIHYVSPHPPFTVSQEIFDEYDRDEVQIPGHAHPYGRPEHPALQHYRKILGYSDGIDDVFMRKVAACYFGVVTRLDQQVGKVLAALEETGLSETTRVVYSSDHGACHGNNYVVHTGVHYQPSVGVPLMMAGPGIPSGIVIRQPTSLIDLFPTFLEAVGEEPLHDKALHGVSLWPAIDGKEIQRPIFSEYHGMASAAGSFMLREGRHKLIYHVDLPPELYDLESDPVEAVNLALTDKGRKKVGELESKLREFVDPKEVDRRAKAAQCRRAEEFGGAEKIIAERRNFIFSPRPGVHWRDG